MKKQNSTESHHCQCLLKFRLAAVAFAESACAGQYNQIENAKHFQPKIKAKILISMKHFLKDKFFYLMTVVALLVTIVPTVF